MPNLLKRIPGTLWPARDLNPDANNGGDEAEAGYDPLDPSEQPKIISDCFKIHTMQEIAASSGEPPPWIIEGLLPERGLATISGRAKSMKSWAVLDLGLAMPLGALWLGMATKEKNVIYVNLEMSEEILNFRVKSLAKHYGMDLEELNGRFLPVTLDCGSLLLQTRQLGLEETFCSQIMSQVIRAAEQAHFKGDTTVLDSFYKLAGGINENDSADVAEVYGAVRYGLKKLESAGLIVHHFPKGAPGDKMEGDRAAGSRVHRQEPDAYIELAPHKVAGAVIFSADLRAYAPMKKFCLSWEFPVLKLAPDLDPDDLQAPPGRRGRPNKKDIAQLVNLLRGQPLSSGEWFAKAAVELGVSESTFQRMRRTALGQNKVRKAGAYYEAI